MNYLYIGKIVNTHGLKGELRILSKFEYIDKVFVKGFKFYIGKDKECHTVTSYRHHKTFEMVTFEGFNNINDVLYMKGMDVYINKEDLVLNKDEYLDEDLIGLKIMSNNEEKGIIKDVESNGSSKLLVVDYNDKEVLIPYNKAFVKSINIEDKIVEINEIEGLYI